MMNDDQWSAREKKIARQAFDDAVVDELAATMADFKRRAAAVTEPAQMWELEQYLRDRQREIDGKYDYRYSQLIWVFGRLLREGRIHEEQLAGLGEDKMDRIRHTAGLLGKNRLD